MKMLSPGFDCSTCTSLRSVRFLNVSSPITFTQPPRPVHRVVIYLDPDKDVTPTLIRLFESIDTNTTRCTVFSDNFSSNGIRADFPAAFPRVTFASFEKVDGMPSNCITDLPRKGDYARSINYATRVLDRYIRRACLMDIKLIHESGRRGTNNKNHFNLTQYTELTRLSIRNKCVGLPSTVRELSMHHLKKGRPLDCDNVTKLVLEDCAVNISQLSNLRSLKVKGTVKLDGGLDRLRGLSHLSFKCTYYTDTPFHQFLSTSLKSLNFCLNSGMDEAQLECVSRLTQLTALTLTAPNKTLCPLPFNPSALPLQRLKLDFCTRSPLPTTLTWLEVHNFSQADFRPLSRLVFLGLEDSPQVLAPLQLQGLVIRRPSSIANARDLHLQQAECIGSNVTGFFDVFATAKHAEVRPCCGDKGSVLRHRLPPERPLPTTTTPLTFQPVSSFQRSFVVSRFDGFKRK